MPQPDQQEDFFDTLHEWSERKLQLLKRYVEAADKILGSINQIYYVDGFAGRGTYRDGKKGSPIRIAELTQQYKSEGKPYSFKCINVEENPEYFTNLQMETAKFGSLVQNLQGRFADHLDHILRVIGNQPAIFFLDPFGIKGIDWSAIKKIINRAAQTDLWIRFDHIEIRRLDGNYEVNGKKFDILPTVFGIEGEDLHSLLTSGALPEVRIHTCMDLYRGQLEREFKRAKRTGFADAYAIKAITGQDKYYLIFATAHEKGIVVASGIVYGVEENYQRELQEYRELQELEGVLAVQDYLIPPEEPTEKEIFEDKVTHLKNDIWKTCKGRKLTRIAIHASMLPKWFGRITTRHVTAALKALQDEKYILEVNGNLSADKTLFRFKASG
jgi:three-Cys-motif partner protein